MNSVFALIDCNNFFVSCERLFRPDLEGRPVVVLSSNDGCAVSRSSEAKALGIPMGAPAFKYRDVFKQHGVVQFSANFELYGDISERITRILTGITPRTEVYSVDESFLDLSALEIDNYGQWGTAIRNRLLREVGVPVSIGISPSKTMSKLANLRAKKVEDLNGVLDLATAPLEDRSLHLSNTPVEDVWGVGWRLAPKLKAEGVFSALDLAQMRSQRASQLMGVHGRQLVAELNGIRCHELTLVGRVRKSVMHGRMFGRDTTDIAVLESAIANLTARATLRLRRSHQLTRRAVICLQTNRHKPDYVLQQQEIIFNTPTADTGIITASLVAILNDMFIQGKEYHRANILLHDFVSEKALQPDLLGQVDVRGSERSIARLKALDNLNERYGKRTVRYAAENLSAAWEPKHELRSPRFTTQWQELPTVRIRPKSI